TTDKNSIILDFFAGSGTTGQAVLELNKKDGGKRQFILATANEITDTTPNGIVNDVTSKRLKRVMTGECYDGTKDFKWNEKNKPLGDNLDVYDISTVAPYSDEPFTQIDETLYGQEKLGVNEKIKWVCENFEGTQKTLEDK
ncbi:MAG: DNA methyltransferase, partial [Candidatus Gracilibacteria bacterium]